jgi:hypothetical protein
MKLNFFTARSYYESGMKYKNPPFSKNTIVFENMINWNLPVVLVEGVFDAISVRRNAIPLMGKELSDRLREMLITKKPPVVYVMLDNDATYGAIKIERYLKSIHINAMVVRPKDKDPSDMGFDRSWNAILGASYRPSFSDFISEKLETV